MSEALTLAAEPSVTPSEASGRTWESIEEMRRGRTLMLQGNPYFAWQLPDGGYRPCRDLNQLAQFEADIFSGEKTVGFYAIRPDNQTRWGALDFDNHGGSVGRDYWRADAERVFESAQRDFAERWLVESSPGGFHVIAFADVLRAARDIRATLLALAPEGVEVFPKQDTLNLDDPKAKGSLLRFPGKHQRKGTWARFIARAGRVLDSPNIPPAPKSKGWQEPSAEGRLASLYITATKGVTITGHGQRFNAYQTIVGRLKGRASESEMLKVITKFYNVHADKITTPFEKVREVSLVWYRKAAPCNVTIPDYPLSTEAEARIRALRKVADVRAVQVADTVRLLLRAKAHADTKGLRVFWLGNRNIATRLNVSERTASRLRAAAVALGVVRVVKLGHTGYCTEFELSADWQPFRSLGMVATPKTGDV